MCIIHTINCSSNGRCTRWEISYGTAISDRFCVPDGNLGEGHGGNSKMNSSVAPNVAPSCSGCKGTVWHRAGKQKGRKPLLFMRFPAFLVLSCAAKWWDGHYRTVAVKPHKYYVARIYLKKLPSKLPSKVLATRIPVKSVRQPCRITGSAISAPI